MVFSKYDNGLVTIIYKPKIIVKKEKKSLSKEFEVMEVSEFGLLPLYQLEENGFEAKRFFF